VHGTTRLEKKNKKLGRRTNKYYMGNTFSRRNKSLLKRKNKKLSSTEQVIIIDGTKLDHETN
jgi:hypothetical protein